MIWLVSCVLLTSLFFIIFKYYEIYKVDTLQAIVVNYLVCTIVGIIFSGGIDTSVIPENDNTWILFALLLGTLFISIFTLMAKTAQVISVAVSSIASKMSMIIPSIVSLIMLQRVRDSFSVINGVGFLIAVIALVFVSLKKTEANDNNKKGYGLIFLGFIGTGTVDTLLNVVAGRYPSDAFQRFFPIVSYLVAFSIGAVVTFIIKKTALKLKNILAGIILGVPNYFSIYTLLKTLDYFNNDATYVYPMLNIAIILMSAFAAYMIFKERLSKLNYIGVVLSILAIVLLSFEEIIRLING